MKKEYMNPETRIFDIKYRHHLLQNSLVERRVRFDPEEDPVEDGF